MKDVLRQLLDAEEAGRQAARAKETAAREFLERARDQAERIVAESRERAAREIADCELQCDKDIVRQQASITEQTALELERVQGDAERLRPQAVAAVVAQLLGEVQPDEQATHEV